MKKLNTKKLSLKKRTINLLNPNQMEKLIGATGDECFSATCPGERGCDDHTDGCPTSGPSCDTGGNESNNILCNSTHGSSCSEQTVSYGCHDPFQTVSDPACDVFTSHDCSWSTIGNCQNP